MTCPICGNKTGFACGTCIDCGYNHITQSFHEIRVDVDFLRKYVPERDLVYLILRHMQRYEKGSIERV